LVRTISVKFVYYHLINEFIDHVLKRGERLEDLMNKTDEMANEADQFRRGATKLKNAMWWKNIRLMIILAVVVIVSFVVNNRLIGTEI